MLVVLGWFPNILCKYKTLNLCLLRIRWMGTPRTCWMLSRGRRYCPPPPPLVLLRLSRHWSFLREIVVNNVVSKNWTRESTIVGHAKIIVLDRLERFVFQWNRLWLTKNDIREIGREMWRWSRGGSRTRRRSWPRRSTGTGTTWPRGWGRSTTNGGLSRWRFPIVVVVVVLIQSLLSHRCWSCRPNPVIYIIVIAGFSFQLCIISELMESIFVLQTLSPHWICQPLSAS